MGLWSALRNVFQPRYSISFDLSDQMAMIQGQTEAELFKTQPHLRTVITFLARNVAQVGLKEFERVSDTDRQRVTDDVLINLLKQPNGTMTGYELLRQLVADLALYDNAYWVVVQNPIGMRTSSAVGRSSRFRPAGCRPSATAAYSSPPIIAFILIWARHIMTFRPMTCSCSTDGTPMTRRRA